RTFVQQTKIINNITVNKSVNVTNIRNVTVMAPITKVDKTIVKVQPVTKALMTRQLQAAAQIRQAVKERQKISAQLVAKGPAPTRPTDRPLVTKVTVPKVTTIKTTVPVRPPAPPALPKHTTKPLPKTDPIKPVNPINPIKPEVKPPVKPKPEAKPPVQPTL